MARASRRKDEQTAEAPALTIVTGMSGAGRTEAAHALEDLGYFVIDNLPPALVGKMVELSMSPDHEIKNIAMVVDLRSGPLFDQLTDALRDLARRGIDYRILFLNASDDVLIRRYEDKKRKHPLGASVVDGIAKERALLETLREAADLVIDTSAINVHELRDRIVAAFSSQSREERMATTVVSFGYKYGLPLDADMVFDVRFLPNPHWEDELRPFIGTDPVIQEYVLTKEVTKDFLERLRDLLDMLVPGFLQEGKRYLTIAVGCTGGRHRSVVIAEQIGQILRSHGLPVTVRHRDTEHD